MSGVWGLAEGIGSIGVVEADGGFWDEGCEFTDFDEGVFLGWEVDECCDTGFRDLCDWFDWLDWLKSSEYSSSSSVGFGSAGFDGDFSSFSADLWDKERIADLFDSWCSKLFLIFSSLS